MLSVKFPIPSPLVIRGWGKAHVLLILHNILHIVASAIGSLAHLCLVVTKCSCCLYSVRAAFDCAAPCVGARCDCYHPKLRPTECICGISNPLCVWDLRCMAPYWMSVPLRCRLWAVVEPLALGQQMQTGCIYMVRGFFHAEPISVISRVLYNDWTYSGARIL